MSTGNKYREIYEARQAAPSASPVSPALPAAPPLATVKPRRTTGLTIYGCVVIALTIIGVFAGHIEIALAIAVLGLLPRTLWLSGAFLWPGRWKMTKRPECDTILTAILLQGLLLALLFAPWSAAFTIPIWIAVLLINLYPIAARLQPRYSGERKVRPQR